ncbi:hypothetical protein PsorP6_005819 [Peronosclerospora sorghi]|uniref:Uncharacterized protein n=1 Tax=Peronosclerospora sorghi TaxID=230839 RepID=A0ACC0W3V6_9STRA|nr:hypothetical protein PsorP6_005819 [Peronosclerospora sorghi]
MIIDAVRWVDASVVNPVASRLAGSVVNPAVLSFLLWDRIKTLTPHRARDLMRLLTTALTNTIGVFGAEKGQEFAASSKHLQEACVRAASSRSGRDVVLNSVAVVYKVVQALNTPETKAARKQSLLTMQSVVDFLASENGRQVISSLSECFGKAIEMAASPEASIFLAELATNLLHTLESEERRQESAQKDEEESMQVNGQDEREIKGDQGMQQAEINDKFVSPIADIRRSIDTESMSSSASETPMTGKCARRASIDGSVPTSHQLKLSAKRQGTTSSPAERNSGYRSARIEKEVLLKMGVDPSMLSEIQRVLDNIAAEEEDKERRRNEEAKYVASLVVPETADSDQNRDNSDAGIAHAFGSAEDNDEIDGGSGKSEDATAPVLLPEWHEQPLREALRRRQAHADAMMEYRDLADRQNREMAAVLIKQISKYGDLNPSDVVACGIIARLIVFCVVLFLLLSAYYLLSRCL